MRVENSESLNLDGKKRGKLYKSPCLVCYGKVNELTKGGGSKPGDAAGNGAQKTKTGVG